MLNDVYYNPTKVFFGKGVENEIGKEAVKYADKALLHYGSGSAKKSGLADRVKKSLEGAGITVFELSGAQSNPRLNLALEGAEICKKENIGLVVAVGGGSVIDSAKTIAAAAVNDDVWERFFVKKEEIEKTLPVAVVLTIPGAGSESSNGMVITKDDTMEKLDAGGDVCPPVMSFLNPEITFTVPAYHTAAGVVDAIAHIMERYFTNTTEVDVTDRMCEGVMRTLIKYAKTVVNDPFNYDARSEIMWACKVAHDNSLGFGREQDWASHMIEHELSAIYDVSHGAGLAVIFPAWMKYVMPHNIERFAQFAMRVFDIEYRIEDPRWTAMMGIKKFIWFCQSVNMPTSLQQMGITENDNIEVMAAACAKHNGGSVGSFVRLYEEDIKNILELAF